MKMKWLQISPGVYVRRDDDAVEVYVTGDREPPKEGGLNVQSTDRLSIEQFADLVSSVSPEAKGKLVNVGTPSMQLLVPQSQAPIFQALLATGGAETMGELVNVGTDETPLLLSAKDRERFNELLVDIVHEQVEKAVAEDRAVRDQDAADKAKVIDATKVNVGADAGIQLWLQPGDAELHAQLVALAVDAAIEKLTAPAAASAKAITA